MKQNKYDDPEFFETYSRMPRSVGGLEKASEWPALRALLPDLRGKHVLDLGCGYGWHCRFIASQNAASVIGVDISEKMLQRARESTFDPRIKYHQTAIEDIDFPDGKFDAVFSSLALHYVKNFDAVCEKVYRCLAAKGVFVMSVEHPIFTSLAAQQWCESADGNQLHWPVDHYQDEGIRHTSWLADDVIKYHRTLATYINTLLDCGFQISKLLEPQPSPEMIRQNPEMKDESRRPIFLLIAANKKEKK